MKTILLLCTVALSLFADDAINNRPIKYTPISHASFIIETSDEVIYVDPAGSIDQYQQYPKPTIILITDIHSDHLAPDLLKVIKGEATLIGPKAVIEKIPGTILKNGDTLKINELSIVAVPMYNTTAARAQFHEKGRGNGYVITVDNKRIYISGDTEDIPEMRSLTNIDDAFICMNLPYTMTVEQAISAVKDFQPKRVFPYHYRGKVNDNQVFSDVKKFKREVEKSESTKVVLLEWY